MRAILLYYLILFVYLSLWACEVIACHLTHSLIILTDSYINLCKILEILLGIIHFKTQTTNIDNNNNQQNSESNANLIAPTPANRLFNRVCTYQFKRLPLLGSFVNKLFLAALLMSAAIEGIQTCFHASHSNIDGESSILHTHPLTYPTLLTGFALVGLIMQWCSTKVHEIREEELSRISNSWSCLSTCSRPPSTDRKQAQSDDCCKLDANRLALDSDKSFSDYNVAIHNSAGKSQIPGLDDDSPNISQISLKSISTNLEHTNSSTSRPATITVQLISDSANKTKNNRHGMSDDCLAKEPLDKIDSYWIIGHTIAPVALVSCALIVYFIHNDIVTEIADAVLAVMSVIVLFVTSCPPMKKAGRVLLQSSPCDVDLEQLKQELLSISEHLIAVKELHVWSLTSSKNGRIGTCQLVFHKANIVSERQLNHLLARAKSKFSNQHINCISVEPKLIQDHAEIEDKDHVNQNTTCHGEHHHHHH